MSFAGHVFDMIRRNKEDRQNLKNLRNRTKDSTGKFKYRVPDISVEEFEAIRAQTKEKEKQEERYFRRMLLIVLIAIAVILLLLYGIYLLM